MIITKIALFSEKIWKKEWLIMSKQMLLRKTTAFLIAMALVVLSFPVSAISTCPGSGGWTRMNYNAETGITTWYMKDGSVIQQDADGTVISSTQGAQEEPISQTLPAASIETSSPDRVTTFGLVLGEYNALLEQKIFDLTNEEREKAGLPKLVWSIGLTDYARIRAKEISESFSHIRPDGERYMGGRENIRVSSVLASGQEVSLDSIAQEAVNAWMASDGHRQAILSYRVDEYGDVWGSQSLAVGCYVDQDGRLWAVQVFNSSISDLDTTIFDDLKDPVYLTPMLDETMRETYLCETKR